MLKPSERQQTDMLVGGLAELLTKVADGKEMFLCLPGTENCFQPSAHYAIDGITEKVILEQKNRLPYLNNNSFSSYE